MPATPDILTQLAYHAEQIKILSDELYGQGEAVKKRKLSPKQKMLEIQRAGLKASFSKRSKVKNS
jgi:hypothetical protein